MARRPKREPTFRNLARDLAEDSIVTQALARFIEQVVEEVNEEARQLERVKIAKQVREFTVNQRIAHDMRAGLFPKQSRIQDAIADAILAAGDGPLTPTPASPRPIQPPNAQQTHD